jgi:hypothetical protein
MKYLLLLLFLVSCDNYTNDTRFSNNGVSKHSIRQCINLSSGEDICRISVLTHAGQGPLGQTEFCVISLKRGMASIPCKDYEIIKKQGADFK